MRHSRIDFGGKSTIAPILWQAFGSVKQYIEPFCGSAAVLLAAPRPASLEVIGDANGFIANFWRAVKHQPGTVAEWADYPVSHIDSGARHGWLMEQRDELGEGLRDPNWPGDPKVAGWWLWGQCAWIGSGWCDWGGQVPHASNAGMGIQALGKVPHASNAGRGIQAIGKIPHVSSAGMGALLTSGGRTAWVWLHQIAARLERVRVVHGAWNRCLNNIYGGASTAVFLDPPYRGHGEVYGAKQECVAQECRDWAFANAHLRVALCGHEGDYDLPGWHVHRWSRKRLTYSGNKTTDLEAVWFSPACFSLAAPQGVLFGDSGTSVA